MECTQRLECTQELYDTHTERVCPEQIGFLGICGAKHPVLMGPNKIGRDPHTCSIVLNLNSVSRQHAVINVLNSKEYMLMDLDSANKTKLLNKTLQPYIPHPMKDGDTVQFGDIFGIFRLLEENDELPMTQAIDIPETPAPNRYVSKLNKVPTTVIPESPDVSDRDDSFISTHSERTRLSSGQFIKSFGKTLSIHPISSPKTDTNLISSKRSNSNHMTSFNESLKFVKDDQIIDNIHEMNTQIPYPVLNPTVNEITESIYTADTQIPQGQCISPSIHNLNTQLPTTEHLPQVRKINGQQEMQFDICAANKENDISIYNAETQPFVSDEIIENKSNLTENKVSDVTPKPVNDLNKSEEELLFDEIDDGCLEDFNSQPLLPQESPKSELIFFKATNVDKNESDNSTDCEDIVPTQKFDEIGKICNQVKDEEKVKSTASKRRHRIKSNDSTDCEDIDIIPRQKVEELVKKNNSEKNEQETNTLSTASNRIKSNVTKVCEDIDLVPTQIVEEINANEILPSASKRINRIKSDSSTDCEDIEIMATQKIQTLPNANKKSSNTAKRVNRIQSDSSTDCEDVALMPTQKVLEKESTDDKDITHCKDDLNKMDLKGPKDFPDTKFEDMPTQVIDLDPDKLEPAFEEMETQIIGVDETAYKKSTINDSFEDQPTQIIDEIVPNNVENARNPPNEINSPFKIPLQSPLRVKSRDIPKLLPKHQNSIRKCDIDNINYYNATQDILDDLCTQRDGSPILNIATEKSKTTKSSPIIIDDEIVPCSVEDYKVGDKFANIEITLSPTKSCAEQNAMKFSASLSSLEVRNVIGVEPPVAELKKKTTSESSSDFECTPKKVRPFLFTDSDLPNSQEIQNNIFLKQNKPYATESSSESEPEVNTEDQFTPFVHRKKKPRTVAKIDLTKRFDVEKLPERVITRVRKPTSKVQESLLGTKKLTANILKPKFITEQEDQIDEDIIKENVKRLKTYGKGKLIKENTSNVINDDNKSETKVENNDTKKKSKDVKNVSTTENNKSKDKIKVKIEKPKKKDVEKDKKAKSKEVSSRKEQDETNKLKSKDKSQDQKGRGDTDPKSLNDKPESEAGISTRSTRSRRKNNDVKTAEKKSTSPDNKKATVDNGRKGRPIRKKEPPKESTSPEVEIRRSRRNVKAKENTSDSQDRQKIQGTKSILKKSIHEQSTVYNISSSSGESNKNLKRSLADDSEEPSPKRTRAFVNNVNSSTNNVSLRATPARTMKTQHVLLTAFPSEEVKQKLEKLGAVVVTNVMECSVVLTIQVKRTFKLLCAVGLGRPIVGPDWVQACVDTRMIVDPWLYLVKDDAAEKRFQFNLERTLSGKRNFLNGYNVSSTPSVQPNASEMKLIVECSGGVWKEGGPNWVCVSSTKDQALWPSLRKRGATIVTTEFILGGVLRQKIDINPNKFP
ncbi:unnamed protein product [Arctia plantaginis]|uniref:Mediator of DNA damage checkpoint protein 1 n=1 Tax=Arctia plantaginis TaxID=874455 RepID=A0A8S0Z7F6_ARCPL|nr:unnamed protein product [Arctia plantaginis]CAB3228366.1 unnamed protein product [Arctia plantaginis]